MGARGKVRENERENLFCHKEERVVSIAIIEWSFYFFFNIGLAACQRLDDHIGSFDAYHAIIAINTKFLN